MQTPNLRQSARGPKRVFYLRVGFSAAMNRSLATLISGLLGFLAMVAGTQVASPRAYAYELHPQDGPHVDLRFDLRDDAFVAELSMNLVFLDELLPPTREEPDRIHLSELEALEPSLLERMDAVCVITADGVRLRPSLEGLAMNDPDEALLPLFPMSGMRGLRKIKFELVYPLARGAAGATAGADDPWPASLSIVWQAYPTDILAVIEPKPPLTIAAELTAQGIRSQLTFTKAEPEYIWHAIRGGLDARLQSVPTPAGPTIRHVSVAGVVMTLVGCGLALINGVRRRWAVALRGLAVAVAGLIAFAVPIGRVALRDPFGPSHPLPTVEEARAIFEPLHGNLYRAFDFTNESAIYDALARSVDGALLEELYLTIHRSLVMQEEGGALSRVMAVRRVEVDIESIGVISPKRGEDTQAYTGTHSQSGEERAGFIVRCTYQVDGRVTHWGHAHERTNEYRARYAVIGLPEGWRIAEAEILSQLRIDRPEDAVAPDRSELIDL